ncbi:MAG: winged helix-turn-helix transcriptional regulator [Clostridia bacterium]|nr:winged helix-turn-helix transcriptional regulator [Clostridia bacterium]
MIVILDKNSISPRQVQQKLMCINRLHRATVNARISATGIHRSQHMILMYLTRCTTTPSQKDIAKHFEISAAAVAVSLKKLEAGGYIKRKCAENDNRYNEIEITEKGKEVVDFSHSIFEEIDAKTFSNINDEEKEQLIFLLNKVLGNLKNMTDKENDI